jgi:multidrug efflux pump subunit AcrB
MTSLTNLAIRYRTAIVVLTLLVVGGGLFSYLTLPKEANPSIEIPQIVVTTVYPGASPDDVESTVTTELERELQGISGIDEIRSTSTRGVSSIVVEFVPDVALDAANQDVREAVDAAESELPDDAEEPQVDEIDTSEFPIMRVNLSADYSLARLKEVAEDLKDELEGVNGVLEASITGGLTREVQVRVDLAALKSYGLTFNDLISTVQGENTNVPGGDIDVADESVIVRVDGEVTDPEEIEEFVVAAPNGQPVRVDDVADVRFGFEDRESYARLKVLRTETDEGVLKPMRGAQRDLKQVLSLSITKRSGENILETVGAVNEVLDAFDLPSGTQVTITGDQSEQVRSLVTDLENNIISGLIFVVAVLLFFMGVRNATLVGIAIPLSMLTSFLVFQVMGYTLNFVILFSLIIALGMLVDNAVVIVENIYRFREAGYDRFEAARLGTAEVGGAVAASTATTVAAFGPMLFWPGIIGEFMSFLPLTLIITLTSSLFVALVINPVVTGYFVEVENGSDAAAPPVTNGAGTAGAGTAGTGGDATADGSGTDDDGGAPAWLGRALAAAGVGAAGLMLGLANWKTLVVVAVGIPVLVLLHTQVFKPVGDRFIESGLPRLVEGYRGVLQGMLQRTNRSYGELLRNAGALGALAVGALLGALGALVGLGAGWTVGAVLLAPAALFGALGAVGVVVHSLEVAYRGARTTVVAGLLTAALLALSLGVAVAGGSVTLLQAGGVVALPLAVAAVGALGMGFAETRPLRLLTDNRAALLNASLGLLLAIGAMFAAAPTGVGFFPDTDPNQIQVTLRASEGTTVEASNEIAREATERLVALVEQYPAFEANVKNMSVNVGVGGDSRFGGGAREPEVSQITLNLVDYIDRAEPSTKTLERVRTRLAGIPGVVMEITRDQQGPPTGPPVNIEVSGENDEATIAAARTVRRRLEEAAASDAVPGLVDVTDNLDAGQSELRVEVDRERAGRFGLSTSQVGRTVRAAVNGTEAGEYRTGEDDYDITVRLQQADRRNIEQLKGLTLGGPAGTQVPLTSVARLEEGSALGSIRRIDLEQVVTVSGDAAPGFTGSEVLTDVQALVDDLRPELPAGVELSYTGQQEDQQESFGFLGTALAVGVALIMMILIAQFNSVTAPFIIMVAVGLSVVGVLLGLIATRTPFSLFTFIGVISLAGIVVNNNIVLVDYIMQLRERGMDKQEAIVEAGATRLRPVLLTALTTILGLVPLTFGINVDFVGLLADFDPNFQIGSSNTQFWGPMGTAIISGLAFGTFLTLVIVPVMYSAFDSLSVLSARLQGAPADEAGIVSETVATTGTTAGAPDARPDRGAARAGGDGRPEAAPTGDAPGSGEASAP